MQAPLIPALATPKSETITLLNRTLAAKHYDATRMCAEPREHEVESEYGDPGMEELPPITSPFRTPPQREKASERRKRERPASMNPEHLYVDPADSTIEQGESRGNPLPGPSKLPLINSPLAPNPMTLTRPHEGVSRIPPPPETWPQICYQSHRREPPVPWPPPPPPPWSIHLPSEHYQVICRKCLSCAHWIRYQACIDCREGPY